VRLRAGLAVSALVALALGAGSPAQPSLDSRVLRLELARAGEARVVVAFRADRDVRTTRARILARLGRSGFVPTTHWTTVPAMAGVLRPSGLAALSSDPDVLRVDLDLPGRGHDAESLPLIRGDVAHAAGVTGAGVTVAVLDSGVDRTHPDLVNALVAEQCFVLPNGCPNGAAEQGGAGSAADDHGHGSNVAGIVVSDGTVAPRGVAPDASLVAVKVLDRGNGFQSLAQIVSALDWIAANRPDVRVVNMSLGTFQLYAGNCDNASAVTLALAAAVSTLRARGAVVFASSGNDGNANAMGAPACISGVVSVGAVYDSAFGPFQFGDVCSDATTAADTITCFSNSGSELDLLAPGALALSTGLGGGASSFAGTSQAAPHAAGAAALALQRNPALTSDAVEAALEATGVRITDLRNELATPRVDIAAALGLQPPQQPSLPDIAVAPRRLVFGGVRIRASGRREVVVTNTGTAPLTVTSASRPPFSVVAGRRLTMAAGARGVVRVAFAPRAARTYRATLTLVSNDPDEARMTVALKGTGTRR
jgi:subtilisin family serine protease